MRKYILFGLALATGAYLYDLVTNLYQTVPFVEALMAVNWGRIIFIGLFGTLVARFLPSRSPS